VSRGPSGRLEFALSAFPTHSPCGIPTPGVRIACFAPATSDADAWLWRVATPSRTRRVFARNAVLGFSSPHRARIEPRRHRASSAPYSGFLGVSIGAGGFIVVLVVAVLALSANASRATLSVSATLGIIRFGPKKTAAPTTPSTAISPNPSGIVAIAIAASRLWRAWVLLSRRRLGVPGVRALALSLRLASLLSETSLMMRLPRGPPGRHAPGPGGGGRGARRAAASPC